jgi:hypothetical protein
MTMGFNRLTVSDGSSQLLLWGPSAVNCQNEVLDMYSLLWLLLLHGFLDGIHAALCWKQVSAIDIHIMLQLDAHINNHFNHDNGIKLSAREIRSSTVIAKRQWYLEGLDELIDIVYESQQFGSIFCCC